jgi:hypothetical protein
MIKKTFENDLASGMQIELRKQASSTAPDLVKAANYLHTALEIFEESGLKSKADDVLKVLQKIAQHKSPAKQMHELPSLKQLMEAGLSQKDMQEFAKGSPIAKAKFNLVLRDLGLSEHQIGKFIGTNNVMSEVDAKSIIDPNRSFSKMWDWMQNPNEPIKENMEFQSVIPKEESVQSGTPLDFKSIAQKKTVNDWHTKNLTPEKMIKNLKHHGTEFNMADKLSKDDMDPDLADLLDVESFDIDASDDDLMGLEIKEDTLEVFDQKTFSDFEEERD